MTESNNLTSNNLKMLGDMIWAFGDTYEIDTIELIEFLGAIILSLSIQNNLSPSQFKEFLEKMLKTHVKKL